MADETQAMQTETAVEPETTLDDVYKEYGIESVARQFQETTAPTQSPPQNPQHGMSVPDPVSDPDGYTRFQMEQASRLQALQQSSTQYGEVLSKIVQEAQTRKVQADINNAVAFIKQKVGGEIEDEMLEVALDLKARRDPRFLQVFNDRDKNPAAWNKALDAVSREFGKKFSVRSDPQLVENQRAVRASQGAISTPHQVPGEWNGIDQSDFDRKWRDLVNS